jgi:K+-sensing histidine kinase KdpD
VTDQDSHRYRQRLYRLQNDDDLSLSETLEGLLDVAVGFLDVANGHLKRTDPDRGVHRVVASAGPEPLAEVGDVHDHAATYCRRTLELDSPLAIADAPAEGWADDPAYSTHELDCYVGTALTVGGEPYGTVCFVAESARPSAFDDEELAFVELVGRVIETELTVEEYTRKLENRDTLLATLNRVLRHNLRNDMNVIRGQARNIAKELDEAGRAEAEVIVEKATELVELGGEARELEAFLAEETPPEPVDVAGMVADVAAELSTDGPAGTVEVRAPDEALALGTTHLRRAFLELGDNALRHAGPEPTVAFDVATPDDAVAVTVRDDGPGLPPSERAILRGLEETQVIHGQGLGLWIVYWAVTDVGGRVEVEVDDGTAVTVELRRADGPDADAEWTEDLYLETDTLW